MCLVKYADMTTTVDWQELYAANQAAIAGARGGGAERERPGLPAGLQGLPSGLQGLPSGLGTLPSGLQGLQGLPGMAEAPNAVPPGEGRWEALPAGGARGAFLYTPPGLPAGPAPLVVMLHGCTQTPASFAAGSQMNSEADRHGFLVLYPEQSRSENPQGCWNWFEARHQARDAGEPAAIVDAIDRARGLAELDPARVFVAGLSAGGAMAAVLAATHPDRFAAAAVHSGLPYGAASGMGEAFGAMAQGAPGGDVTRAMGRHARPLPLLVVHGTADRTVAPVNGEKLLAQWARANGVAAAPTKQSHGVVPDGYRYTRSTWLDAEGRAVLGSLAIDGLGHAWSGGAPGGSYTDPRGPSASAAMWRFFAEAA